MFFFSFVRCPIVDLAVHFFGGGGWGVKMMSFILPRVSVFRDNSELRTGSSLQDKIRHPY